MTLIQAFLRSAVDNGAPATTEAKLACLQERYAISAKRHLEHPNLVLLKYSMVDSPMAEPLVRECRGIILDEDNGWHIVSRAFDKFFNHGEGHAAPIDWGSARVQEKLDGSLCVLYWYADRWHVATSGTPDARGNVNGADSFAAYFWRTFDTEGAGLPIAVRAHEHCYYFELTGPANRIVVVHAAPSLTLLGARDLVSQVEVPVSDAAGHFAGRVKGVREFPLTSVDDIVASFAAISPLSQEGYVVVDGNFNRQKIKHPGYVALHHAKDGMGPKAFIEIARSGETSEVIVAFPEFKPLLDEAVARLEPLIAEVEADYERLRGIVEQKAFAIEAVKTRCSAAMFAMRAGKTKSVRRFFAEMRIEFLMKTLGYKEAA